MKRATWLVCLILLEAAGWLVVPSRAGAAEGYGKVELVRDRWGVPHVFAETDAGAMYGLGYATAEDRGFQMHYTLRIIQGRLAELVGDVKKTRRKETAVQNDRKMRTFGFDRAAREVAGNLDADTIALLEAYSRGVNDYFDGNSDKLPQPFAQVGLVPERWTPAACLLSWWHVAQFFATDGTRDLMHYRNLTGGRRPGRPAPAGRGGRRPPAGAQTPPAPDDSTAVVQRGDVSDAWLGRARAFLKGHGFREDGTVASIGLGRPGPKFSHAWVVDGQTTGTGSAVLVSDPQTPVANPSLFYEFHIQGGSFNARGVGVAGSPTILIGWNERVAWGMTALGADQADLFRLKTDREHPDQYEFDGEWRPMEIFREEIRVKGRPAESITIRQTHLGPVVSEFAFSTPGDPPVAMKRVPMCETDRETFSGALAMLRAKDVEEFHAALADWRFPTANVVFGDAEGRIGFSLAGALPLRSPLALEGGSAAHDGSGSEYDWRAIIPHELKPHVIEPDRGCLFSGNHRPVGVFYPIPLGIRTGSMGDTVRSWRLRELLEGRTSLTPKQVLDVHYDAVNPARRTIVRLGLHLRDGLGRELSAEAGQALERLEGWYEKGASSGLDVPGAELATEINTMFRFVTTELAYVYGGGDSGLSRFLKTVGRRLDENARAAIEPLEEEYVDRMLSGAWQSAVRKYGRDPEKWNALARLAVTERRLGYFESLDGFPSLDPAQDLALPSLRCVDGQTILSQGAQSYTQWVPLGDVDGALSLLPLGSSERVGDPMRTVNRDSWAAGELHPAPLSREAVERYARSKTVLVP